MAALFTLYFFCNSPGASDRVEKDTVYGPFTIRAMASTSKQLNMNYGIVNQTSVAYAILYNGKPVPFPDALQNNTGLPYLWRVYALPGAPDPTLIAGSQSLYLVYLKNGAMYSVFFLGGVMLLNAFGFHVYEWVSPAVTFVAIGYFFLKSAREAKAGDAPAG